MNIVYLIKQIHSIGGIEKITIQKMNWLAEHSHNVWLITTDQNNQNISFRIDPRINLIDLNINYNLQKKRNILSRIYHGLLNKIKHINKLQNHIDVIKPNVIISTLGNETGIVPNLNTNAIYIAEFHSTKGYFENRKQKGLRKFIDKYMIKQLHRQIKRYDYFVVLSQSEIPLWNTPNIKAIPNFSEQPHFHNTINNCKKRVIAVGRLSTEKDFVTLVDIWYLTNARKKNWHLEIFGDGNERKSIENRINELELNDSISLKGFCTDYNIIYKDASLLLMTSIFEGFGLVLTEAHNYGVPTITFECNPGIKDIVINGINGYVIAPRDKVEYAKTVDKVLANNSLLTQLQKGAYDNSHRFDKDIIMNQWIALFQSK